MKWLLSVSLIALAIAVAGPSAASSDDVPDWLAPSLADSESAQDPTEDGSPPSDVERDSQAEETEELAPPPELADEDLGVLDAVEASAEFEVPDSRLWHAPQGNLVLADTMVVRTEVGTRLERVSDRPGKGEYRPRRDGCVRFSKADVGRKLRATYEYCPLRICLLPPVMATDYEDAWPTVLEVLTQEAVARGFVLADPDEVADALVDLEVSGPEDYPRLAEYLDVGSFVLTGIAASADAVFAGYSTSGHTSVSGNVSTSGNISHISGHEDTHTTTSARYKDIMVVTVGLRIYDGATGNLVGEVYRSDSNRVFFRRFGPTRRSLARYLTEKCVSALLDPQS